MLKKILYHPFFIRLFNWEYWSFNTVYFPMYPIWFLLALRARSFFFFNTSNPSIKNGGFLMESKKEIYDLIPQEYYPRTLLFRPGADISILTDAVKTNNIAYPLICKPDIGMRGLQVKKIHSPAELEEYALHIAVDFLVQEFCAFEHEAGIFYYRYPHESKGHISGVVGKEFLTVTGDGISTTEQLLQRDKRYILQLPVLRRTDKPALQTVLQNGETMLLVPYGNHARGAKFLDITHMVDEQLISTIDEIAKEVNGFYFGRLDVRYSSWEELKQGKNFSIIELNGAGSEPTHMYDPKHSVFFAWKEIIRHWIIMLKISRYIHKSESMPYMTHAEGMQMLRDNSAYVKKIT